MVRIWALVAFLSVTLPFASGDLAPRSAKAGGCFFGGYSWYPSSFYVAGVPGGIYAGPFYGGCGRWCVSRASYTGFYGYYRWSARSVWYPAYYSSWVPSGYYYYPGYYPYYCGTNNTRVNYVENIATRPMPEIKNSALTSVVDSNRVQWEDKVQEIPDWVYVAVRPSSLQDQLKALKAQSRGDRELSRGNRSTAIKNYRKAVNFASDKAEYRISLAVALADQGNYDAAVELLQSAMALSPDFEDEVRPLKKIYAFNVRKQASLIEGVKAWNRKNQEDPKRLLLTGIMFYLNGEQENAKPFLQVAQRTVNEKLAAETFLAAIDGRSIDVTPSIPPVPEIAGTDNLTDPIGGVKLTAAPVPEN